MNHTPATPLIHRLIRRFKPCFAGAALVAAWLTADAQAAVERIRDHAGGRPREVVEEGARVGRGAAAGGLRVAAEKGQLADGI